MNTTDTELLEDVKQIRNLSDTTIRKASKHYSKKQKKKRKTV